MAKKLKIRVLPKFHNHGILSALSNHPLNWVHQIAAIFTGQRKNSWPKTGQLLVGWVMAPTKSVKQVGLRRGEDFRC